jgi:hypothetical protein
MTHKKLWCGILVLVLTVGLATPVRAIDPEGVLIIIAAATAAAAIAAVATVASVEHKRKKIVITGCIVSGEKGMTVTDEEDRKLYTLSGDTAAIKPGDRVKLLGKKEKAKGSGKSLVWESKAVIKDFGVCQP